MDVSAELPLSSVEDDYTVVDAADCAPSPLTFDTHVGLGVRVTVDLLRPDHLCRVSVAGSGHAPNPVVDAVTSASAVVPWLRVAVVDALDRWLHLPLEQDLLDAERGVTRLMAALSLPEGADALVGDALHLARRGAAGVVRSIRRLSAADLSEGGPVRAAFQYLVDGYAALERHVSGRDRQLAAVARAWAAITASPSTGMPAARRHRAQRLPEAAHGMIDPRRVRARTLALSADPGVGEVELSVADDGQASVRVAAFGTAAEDALARPLLVRVVDRGGSEPLGHGVLVVPAAVRRSRSRTRSFQATVPLRGAGDDLRVDVHDTAPAPGDGRDVPPAEADRGLGDARRAAVFLAQWRQLVTALSVHASPQSEDPVAATVMTIAEHLRSRSTGPDVPAFPGGPTPAELLAITHDEAVLAARLHREELPDGPLTCTRGAGALLVAEWAAATERG